VKVLIKKVVGVIESIDLTLHYFCENFQDFKLLCAT